MAAMDTIEMEAISIPAEETSSFHVAPGDIIQSMTRKLIPVAAGLFFGLLLALAVVVHSYQPPATVSSDTAPVTVAAVGFASLPPSTSAVASTVAAAAPVSQSTTQKAAAQTVPPTSAAPSTTQPATTQPVSVPQASVSVPAPTVPGLPGNAGYSTTTERARHEATVSMGGQTTTICTGFCEALKHTSTT